MAFRCHVGGLAWETTKESLETAFSDYGVSDAYIVTNRQSGRSRGYGFVTFADEKDMIRAIHDMDGEFLDGRSISVSVSVSVSKAHPSENAKKRGTSNGHDHQEESDVGYSGEDEVIKTKYQCRVSGLSNTTDGQSLGEAFTKFGDVRYAKVIDYYDHENDEYKSKGYGYVTFASKEDMMAAIEGMNGQELDGSKITVEQVGYPCFVGGLAKKTDDKTLQKVFNRFGKILDVDVLYGFSKKTGRGYRFGFVTFDTEKAVSDAIEGKNKKKIDGREVIVNQG